MSLHHSQILIRNLKIQELLKLIRIELSIIFGLTTLDKDFIFKMK